MKTQHIIAVLYLSLLASVAVADDRPNIILAMADDQGWGDVAYNGGELKTPVLDEMAKSGIRFDRFYAAAPVCSPTRGSVLTGRHPNRFGCFTWGRTLRPQEITLAEILQKAGYATGHFGKWHLGSVRKGSPVSPGGSGFDIWASAPNFYENDPLLSVNGKVARAEGESSMVAVDAALEFIDDAAEQNKPFLAVVWFGSPHTPHIASNEMKALYATEVPKIQHYKGEISGIDAAMGKLRKELRERNLADNTLLWYTSDNGAAAPGSVGNLSGKKGQLLEGGIRVPAIIEWPAHFKIPAATQLAACTVDILPTVLAAAGVEYVSPHELDGVNLLPLIEQNESVRDKPLGFWVYPGRGQGMKSEEILKAQLAEEVDGQPAPPDALDAGDITIQYPLATRPGHAALIDNQYKLHAIPTKEDGISYRLFDLADDPKETHNLIEQQPDRVKKMKAALIAWQESVINSLNGKDYAKE